jgi:hypothetical protein
VCVLVGGCACVGRCERVVPVAQPTSGRTTCRVV